MQQSAHLSSPLHHFPPPTSLHCPPRSLAISPHTFTSSSCSHPLLLSNEWIQHRRLFPPLAGVVQRIQLFSTGSSRHIVKASNEASSAVSKNQVVEPESVSVILLAGGQGKRMGANMPKQYLPLLGQPIALYSFYTFINMVEVKEIVVVCDPSYRDIFEDAAKSKPGKSLKFALPGKERQDSVLSGLKEICDIAKLACVHDSARPLVMTRDIHNVLADAWIHGAAVLGVPVKATIKEADKGKFVVKTLDRRCLWEMQTPQVIEPSLLLRGFELIHQQNLEVTDDVSIVEYLNHPVIITEGSYTNIKVTTPDDMLVAERILHQSGAPVKVS